MSMVKNQACILSPDIGHCSVKTRVMLDEGCFTANKVVLREVKRFFLKVTHFLTLRRFYTNILLFFCPACDSFSSKNMLLHRTKNLNINHSWLDKLGEYSIGCWWTYAHLSLIIIKVQYLQIFLRDAQTLDVLIFFKKNFVLCSIWNSPCPT